MNECHEIHAITFSRWERDNTPIAAFTGKYEWAGDRTKGDCSLRILNANFDYDNGGWVCQVRPACRYTSSKFIAASFSNFIFLKTEDCFVPGDCFKLQRKGHLDIPSSKLSRQRYVFPFMMILRIKNFKILIH